MKRILITGVTGYIGARLARALLPECQVYGLVRQPVRTDYISDFQNQLHLLPFDGSYESMEAAMREACPDLVYHLAAHYTWDHGSEETPALIAANITMGAYLLEAMVAAGSLPLVYSSTVMAHYEGERYSPLNLYAATKQAFSDLLAYYTDVTGLLRAVTLILSDTYGPDDHRPKVLNLIKHAVQTKESLALSDGHQDYDVVYIDDVVQAFLLAGQQIAEGAWKNEQFQVVPEKPLTLRQTVELMLQVNGLTWNPDWGQRPAPQREIHRAVRICPTLPGWKPQVPLSEGLRRFFVSDQEMAPHGAGRNPPFAL